MISKHSYDFCKEDVCLIENYDKAMNDTTQTWDCHHRLEIELNMSRAELVKSNLYVNRPASELIFLTHDEHTHLHNLYKDWKCFKGENNLFYNKHHTKEKRNYLSIKAQEQWSDPEARVIQRKRRHMNNGINRVFCLPEEFDYYLKKGYHFGFKL